MKNLLRSVKSQVTYNCHLINSTYVYATKLADGEKLKVFLHLELWTRVSSAFFMWETNHRIIELFDRSVCIGIMELLNVRSRDHGAQWFSISLSNRTFTKLFKLSLCTYLHMVKIQNVQKSTW